MRPGVSGRSRQSRSLGGPRLLGAAEYTGRPTVPAALEALSHPSSPASRLPVTPRGYPRLTSAALGPPPWGVAPALLSRVPAGEGNTRAVPSTLGQNDQEQLAFPPGE